MPPRNPSAGKRPANHDARVRAHTRADGTRVKSHTRSVKGRRMVAAGASAGTSGVVALFTIAEAGFTIATALAVVLTGAFTWLAVIAAGWAADNKAKLGAQRKTRTSTRKRPGTRSRARKTTRHR